MNKTAMNKIAMYARITVHGDNLKRIFNRDDDPVKLCKKIRSLELKAERIALDYANGLTETDQAHQQGDQILEKLDKILHFSDLKIPVFLNYDPRGYAFKIRDDYMRDHQLKLYSDWGGYGILAPDLSLEG